MAAIPGLLRRTRSPLRRLLALALLAGISLLGVQPLGPASSELVGVNAADRSDGFVPLAGATGAGLPIATAAPELVGRNEPALTDLSGRPVQLAEFRGRPVWLVFWATWCPPCREEMQALSATAEKYANAGLVVLALNVEEPTGQVEAFVNELDLRMRVLTDPRARSMRQWVVFGLPTHYLVAPDGSIAWRWFGPLEPAEINRLAREAAGLVARGDGSGGSAPGSAARVAGGVGR